jgi:hypothetical protein
MNMAIRSSDLIWFNNFAEADDRVVLAFLLDAASMETVAGELRLMDWERRGVLAGTQDLWIVGIRTKMLPGLTSCWAVTADARCVAQGDVSRIMLGDAGDADVRVEELSVSGV